VGKKRRWIFPQQQFSLFVGKESDEMAEGEQKKIILHNIISSRFI
jgi:hypothetical protein